jgi:hypothetical protein
MIKSEQIERLNGFLTSIGDLNMKMFRPALAGILPAFVLLIGLQLNARAASTPPAPEMQPWVTGDDTVNNHIWPLGGHVLQRYTCAAAKEDGGSRLRQLSFSDHLAYQPDLSNL